eukprot:m.295164 g.295164  ORF g.295164 m.295164 type:complete len:77 (-) comp27173_c0_seq1:349-579(-)
MELALQAAAAGGDGAQVLHSVAWSTLSDGTSQMLSMGSAQRCQTRARSVVGSSHAIQTGHLYKLSQWQSVSGAAKR